jgi:hypothetical protein
MSTLTETTLEYRLRGLEAISSSGPPTGSFTGTECCGCADFDRNRLRRCGRLPDVLFKAPSSSSVTATSVSETVLDRLLRATGRVNVEPRREGADNMANKFEVEVFVRGFVSLVGGLRGASADCVFPILSLHRKLTMAMCKCTDILSIKLSSYDKGDDQHCSLQQGLEWVEANLFRGFDM